MAKKPYPDLKYWKVALSNGNVITVTAAYNKQQAKKWTISYSSVGLSEIKVKQVPKPQTEDGIFSYLNLVKETKRLITPPEGDER